MPSFKVPGFKSSTGVKPFTLLVDGDYELECVKCEIKPPKNPAPLDVWTFTFNVLAGPPQADGSSAKGRRYMEWVSIFQEEHPSFTDYGHIGVDQLKSMALASGVQGKGDNVNPDSFAGTQMSAHIVQDLPKPGDTNTKPRNSIQSCSAAE